VIHTLLRFIRRVCLSVLYSQLCIYPRSQVHFRTLAQSPRPVSEAEKNLVELDGAP
jgi:hypothetical protein